MSSSSGSRRPTVGDGLPEDNDRTGVAFTSMAKLGGARRLTLRPPFENINQ
jgi:hypothetical protein